MRRRIQGSSRSATRPIARPDRHARSSATPAAVSGNVAGILLWTRSGDRASYRLDVYSNVGYRSRAAHAPFEQSLRDSQGVATVALLDSGGRRRSLRPNDDLVLTKRSLLTVERIAHLHDGIVNAAAYHPLAERTEPTAQDSPAYRARRPTVKPAGAR